MPYGFWSKAGLRWRWPRRWDGMPCHWPVGCRLRRGRSGGDGLRAVGWFPPAIDGVQQTELKAVVQEFPAKVGLDLANWNWKVVRRFVQERFEVSLSRSSCLNYPRLHGGRHCTAWDLC